MAISSDKTMCQGAKRDLVKGDRFFAFIGANAMGQAPDGSDAPMVSLGLSVPCIVDDTVYFESVDGNQPILEHFEGDVATTKQIIQEAWNEVPAVMSRDIGAGCMALPRQHVVGGVDARLVAVSLVELGGVEQR